MGEQPQPRASVDEALADLARTRCGRAHRCAEPRRQRRRAAPARRGGRPVRRPWRAHPRLRLRPRRHQPSCVPAVQPRPDLHRPDPAPDRHCSSCDAALGSTVDHLELQRQHHRPRFGRRWRSHADQGYAVPPWPPSPLAVNVAWVLDDYTPEVGATRYVPGSHLLGHGPEPGATYETVPIDAPAGSLVGHGRPPVAPDRRELDAPTATAPPCSATTSCPGSVRRSTGTGRSTPRWSPPPTTCSCAPRLPRRQPGGAGGGLPPARRGGDVVTDAAAVAHHRPGPGRGRPARARRGMVPTPSTPTQLASVRDAAVRAPRPTTSPRGRDVRFGLDYATTRRTSGCGPCPAVIPCSATWWSTPRRCTSCGP